jgi:hypothetical protein
MPTNIKLEKSFQKVINVKGGHPQFMSAPQQLCNIVTTKSIVELRTKKSCRTAIADFQNLISAIPQLSAV